MATGYVFKSSDYDAIGGISMEYPNLIYADVQLWIELTKKSYLAVSPAVHFAFRIHQSTTKTSKDYILLKAFVRFLEYLHIQQNTDTTFKKIIHQLGPAYIANTTRSLSHRLLRTEKKYRDGLSLSIIFNSIGKIAQSMGINYDPTNIPTMKVTMMIDSNPITHGMFLLFKKWYKKPIY
jgi:hypothetical protein